MSDKLLERIVARFLNWKLPDNFNPDNGISFIRNPRYPMPTGTNLLDYTQAEQMVRYILAEENAFDCYFSDTLPYLQHKRDCAAVQPLCSFCGHSRGIHSERGSYCGSSQACKCKGFKPKPCTCGLAKLEEKYGRKP